MAKISFTKVESILTDTLRKMTIDKLSELAAIMTLMQNPSNKLDEKTIAEILKRFQSELEKLRTRNPQIYQSLNLSKEDEEKFNGDVKNLTQEDWSHLKLLKDRIEELKKELNTHEILADEKCEEQIHKERLKHENKRFNVKEGWLPLD